MPKKKTHEKFVNDVFESVNNEYIILGKYINAHTKVKIKHVLCDFEYEVTPNNFIDNKRRCPKCSGNFKKDTKQFKNEVSQLVGEEYSVMSEYKNAKNKIKFKHNTCGNFFDMQPSSFLSGCRCPICNQRKKTKEQFEKELKNVFGDEYEALEEYVNSDVKIKFRHNICNYVWKCNPSSLLNKYSQCPNCSIRNKKESGVFKKEIFDLVGEEYLLLEEYKGAHSKILMRHVICGHEWMITPDSFLHGTCCPSCANKKVSERRKFTSSQYYDKVYNVSGKKYVFLTEYKGMDKLIKIKCTVDGYIWTPQAGAFLYTDCKCPKCSNSVKTKDTLYFKKEIFDLCGHEYELISEYKGSKTKVILQHNCGYKWTTKPSDFLNGNRCPNCNGGIKRKTTNDFKKQIFDLVKDEYEVLGEYKNRKSRIKFKHLLCQSEYETTPSTFLSGGRCPICAESKGEQKIRELLTENMIVFQREFSFDDCKDKLPLPFDFAIFDDTEKVNIKYLIEYDGEFHYKIIKKFKSESNKRILSRFKYQQYHDQLKNEYCQKNNIKLIRIPYWNFDNIEQILKDNNII